MARSWLGSAGGLLQGPGPLWTFSGEMKKRSLVMLGDVRLRRTECQRQGTAPLSFVQKYEMPSEVKGHFDPFRD